tara:strand:- start:5015 stop:5521 length:507 start_codon:yes stop_codon:yes gene_type:complete
MFSAMMAAMAGKAGFPNGLVGDEEPDGLDENGLPKNPGMPGEVPPVAPVVNVATNTAEQAANPTLGQMVGQRMEGLRDIASDPGAYAMGRIGGAVDRVTSLTQDPLAYAEQRMRMALDGTLDEEERAAAKSRARMQQFQSQAMQDYQAGQRATQLPTGYFNSAQRGLM